MNCFWQRQICCCNSACYDGQRGFRDLIDLFDLQIVLLAVSRWCRNFALYACEVCCLLSLHDASVVIFFGKILSNRNAQKENPKHYKHIWF